MVLKKLTLFLVAALGLSLCASAQMYDVLDRVTSDRRLQCGCECPYIFDGEHSRTPAPKGYKAVYLSHYGRHGSRYHWNHKPFDEIGLALSKADSLGLLTPKGEQFKSDFDEYRTAAELNLGDLLPLGWEQHEKIAESIYGEFRSVFKARKEVNAMSSITGRAITSMGAFCTGLQKMDSRLDIKGNAVHTDMPVTNPKYAPQSIMPEDGDMLPPAADEGRHEFFARMIDADEALGEIFTDTAFIGPLRERQDLLGHIFSIYQNYAAYSVKPFLEDIFTPEQEIRMWEIYNYFSYVMLRKPGLAKPLMKDIVSRADAALAGGSVAMDARFGHDTVVGYLTGLMNINDATHPVDRAEDLKYWFQNFNIPKAATLVFVFYTSKKSDTTLFKLLYNGEEATLPHLHPVSGPYYDFAELKAWAAKLD